MVLHMEMTPFLILRKALLGVTKLGDKCQIWCLCRIVNIWCISKIIFYQKSIKYPIFHHFDF